MASDPRAGADMGACARLATTLLCVTSLFASGGCGDVDLRPPEIAGDGITAERRAQGQALLAATLEASGGAARWDSLDAARVTLTDTWPGLLVRWLYHPWPEHGAPMRAELLLGTDAARMEFLEGKAQGEVWGFRHGKPYRTPAGERAIFGKNRRIAFFVPRLQMLFELPYRLRTAETLAHAGEDTVNGRAYDLLFASGGGLGGAQYVLWIGRDTGLVDFARYALPRGAPARRGVVQYDDFRDVDGFTVPFRARVVVGDRVNGDGALHEIVLDRVEFVDLPIGHFFPDSLEGPRER